MKCAPPMLSSVFVERTRYIPLLTSIILRDKDVPPSLNTKILLQKKDNINVLSWNHNILKLGWTLEFNFFITNEEIGNIKWVSVYSYCDLNQPRACIYYQMTMGNVITSLLKYKSFFHLVLLEKLFFQIMSSKHFEE